MLSLPVTLAMSALSHVAPEMLSGLTNTENTTFNKTNDGFIQLELK